jgi:hypothetical protein
VDIKHDSKLLNTVIKEGNCGGASPCATNMFQQQN